MYYFVSAGLYERRECLRKALFRYCSNMLSANVCSQQTDTRSRRKRSVDEVNYNQRVKYAILVVFALSYYMSLRSEFRVVMIVTILS